MSLEELAGVKKRLKFPKLRGDWSVSCSSHDPSDSGTDDFSRHSSCKVDSALESARTALTANSDEYENFYNTLWARKYELPRRVELRGEEDPFKYDNFVKNLTTQSCIGPLSDYVVLISSDEHTFIIKRKHAMGSKTLQMYFNRTHPTKLNLWDLNNRVPSLVLQWVCIYLVYKSYYSKYEDILKIPDFPIPYVLAYDLLMAGYMLKC